MKLGDLVRINLPETVRGVYYWHGQYGIVTDTLINGFGSPTAYVLVEEGFTRCLNQKYLEVISEAG